MNSERQKEFHAVIDGLLAKNAALSLELAKAEKDSAGWRSASGTHAKNWRAAEADLAQAREKIERMREFVDAARAELGRVEFDRNTHLYTINKARSLLDRVPCLSSDSAGEKPCVSCGHSFSDHEGVEADALECWYASPGVLNSSCACLRYTPTVGAEKKEDGK